MDSQTEPQPTGNPVFDFQAAHRRSSQRLQGWLMKFGLLLMAAGFAGVLAAPETYRVTSLSVGGAGILLLFGGVWWGFHWRNKLRNDFKREYGETS